MEGIILLEGYEWTFAGAWWIWLAGTGHMRYELPEFMAYTGHGISQAEYNESGYHPKTLVKPKTLADNAPFMTSLRKIGMFPPDTYKSQLSEVWETWVRDLEAKLSRYWKISFQRGGHGELTKIVCPRAEVLKLVPDKGHGGTMIPVARKTRQRNGSGAFDRPGLTIAYWDLVEMSRCTRQTFKEARGDKQYLRLNRDERKSWYVEIDEALGRFIQKIQEANGGDRDLPCLPDKPGPHTLRGSASRQPSPEIHHEPRLGLNAQTKSGSGIEEEMRSIKSLPAVNEHDWDKNEAGDTPTKYFFKTIDLSFNRTYIHYDDLRLAVREARGDLIQSGRDFYVATGLLHNRALKLTDRKELTLAGAWFLSEGGQNQPALREFERLDFEKATSVWHIEFKENDGDRFIEPVERFWITLLECNRQARNGLLDKVKAEQQALADEAGSSLRLDIFFALVPKIIEALPCRLNTDIVEKKSVKEVLKNFPVDVTHIRQRIKSGVGSLWSSAMKQLNYPREGFNKLNTSNARPP